MRVFLLTANDLATIEEVLEEAGYVFQDGEWASPPWVGVERHSLSVGV